MIGEIPDAGTGGMAQDWPWRRRRSGIVVSVQWDQPLPPEVLAALAADASHAETHGHYGTDVRRWSVWAHRVLDAYRAACAGRGAVPSEEDGWMLLFLAVNAPRVLWESAWNARAACSANHRMSPQRTHSAQARLMTVVGDDETAEILDEEQWSSSWPSGRRYADHTTGTGEP